MDAPPDRRAVPLAPRPHADPRLSDEATSTPRPGPSSASPASNYYGDAGRPSYGRLPRREGHHGPDLRRVGSSRARGPAGVRVVTPRTAVVLSRSGGALGRLLPLLRLGVGGPLGNGRQYWPWITLPDLSAAFGFLLTAQLSGPVIVSAPEAANVNTLVAELAAALHRPALLRVPAPALRLAMGKLADELLLASQRVEPALLKEAGFQWQHPSLRGAAAWVVAAPDGRRADHRVSRRQDVRDQPLPFTRTRTSRSVLPGCGAPVATTPPPAADSPRNRRRSCHGDHGPRPSAFGQVPDGREARGETGQDCPGVLQPGADPAVRGRGRGVPGVDVAEQFQPALPQGLRAQQASPLTASAGFPAGSCRRTSSGTLGLLYCRAWRRNRVGLPARLGLRRRWDSWRLGFGAAPPAVLKAPRAARTATVRTTPAVQGRLRQCH